MSCQNHDEEEGKGTERQPGLTEPVDAKAESTEMETQEALLAKALQHCIEAEEHSSQTKPILSKLNTSMEYHPRKTKPFKPKAKSTKTETEDALAKALYDCIDAEEELAKTKRTLSKLNSSMKYRPGKIGPFKPKVKSTRMRTEEIDDDALLVKAMQALFDGEEHSYQTEATLPNLNPPSPNAINLDAEHPQNEASNSAELSIDHYPDPPEVDLDNYLSTIANINAASPIAPEDPKVWGREQLRYAKKVREIVEKVKRWALEERARVEVNVAGQENARKVDEEIDAFVELTGRVIEVLERKREEMGGKAEDGVEEEVKEMEEENIS